MRHNISHGEHFFWRGGEMDLVYRQGVLVICIYDFQRTTDAHTRIQGGILKNNSLGFRNPGKVLAVVDRTFSDIIPSTNFSLVGFWRIIG